jgi:hypothetical protein
MFHHWSIKEASMPEPKPSPLTQPDRPTAFNAVAGLAQTVTNADVKGKSLEASSDQGAGGAIRDLVEIANAIGKYGVASVIFAMPCVVACFGLYFMSIGVNAAQVNMAKVWVGIFDTVFGSGLLVLLLILFNKMELWEKIGKLSIGQQKKRDA